MSALAHPGARDIPNWVSRYIGLPFKDHARGPREFDCWGLVRWVLAHEFGLADLPEHSGYAHTDHGPSVAATFDEGLAESWRRVERRAQAGDIVILTRIMRVAGEVAWRPAHVGLIVAQDIMLHIERRSASVVERFDRPPWDNRIEGIYRHIAMRGDIHG